MQAPYIDALQEYGLSSHEVQIYVTLLKLQESSVQTIAKNAGIARTTTYHILESLLQKGFVSSIVKENIKYFQAVNPQLIVKKIDDKKKRLQDVVPELLSLSGKITQKPHVELFEGVKGVRTVLDLVLEEKSIIYHMGDITSLQQILPFAFPHFVRTRVERKIPIKIICKKEDAHKELLTNSKKDFREFVFVPRDFSSNVFIFSGQVAILNLTQEPYYCFLITDKDYYQTQLMLFELLWVTYQKK